MARAIWNDTVVAESDDTVVVEGNHYFPADAVRAETCDACKSYLKIVYQEKGPVDPVADDLATLTLDILVDEAGYARSGPNLLLVPGG